MATEVSATPAQELARSVQAPVVDSESSTPEPNVSILDLLVMLSEQKRTVLRCTAVATVLSVLLSFVLPKNYLASATLMPPQQNSSMASALSSQLGGMAGMATLAGAASLGLKNPNDMYAGMLKSRTVEDAMVQRFDLQKEYHKRFLSDARKSFESHAKIDTSGKDGLIRLSVEDRNPQRAAELANGYVEELRNLTGHLAITEASQRRLFFEQQLEQAKDNLANAEEALKQTEQQTGLIQMDSQARALIESASSLRAQIAAKEVEIQSMQTFATSQNSQLVQAEQELESLRAQLAKLGGSEEGGDAGLIVPKGRVPQAGLEYVRKLRDVKYYETIFDILARQFEVAKLDEAKQGAVIQVVDSAVPPDRPSGTRKLFIILGGTIAGFMIGILWALSLAGLAKLKTDPLTESKFKRLRRALTF